MLRQCPLCLWMRRVVRRRHVMLTALSHASSSRTGLASTWRCRGRRAGIAVADLSLFSVPALTLPRNYENHLTHSTLSPGIVIYDGTSSNNDFTHDSVTYTAVQGTKEHDYCSNRGFCDQTKGAWTWCVDGWMCGYVGGHVSESGVDDGSVWCVLVAACPGDCICYEGYGSSNQYGEVGIAGDCGHLLTPITACPGEIECSGHGLCHDHPTYRCECDDGWQGGDCAERTCPFDFAWFDDPSAQDVAHAMAECSNRGVCNRVSGECVCQKGFTGTACERSTCLVAGQGSMGTWVDTDGECCARCFLQWCAQVPTRSAATTGAACRWHSWRRLPT